MPVPRRKPATRKPANLRNVVGDTPNPPRDPAETLREETPPKSAAKETASRASSKPRSGTLEARLAEAFSGMVFLPAMAGDQYSAFIIATRSARFAHDLAELAKVNPRVKKILEGLLDGGTYGGVFFSGAAMLLPILWAYGIIPPPPIDPFAPFYPNVPPEVIAQLQEKQKGRSTRKSTGQNRRADRKQESESGHSPASAPGSNGDPIGVVTVKPGTVPPVNPAAM